MAKQKNIDPSDIVLKQHPSFNYFLVEYFAGWLHGYKLGFKAKDPAVKKYCQTNYLRLYKFLSVEQKEQLRDVLKELGTDPKGLIDNVKDRLEDLKDIF